MMRGAWQQEYETSDNSASAVRKQTKMHAGSQLTVSPLFSSGPSPCDGDALIQGGSSTSVRSVSMVPLRHLSIMVLNPTKMTIKLNHQNIYNTAQGTSKKQGWKNCKGQGTGTYDGEGHT